MWVTTRLVFIGLLLASMPTGLTMVVFGEDSL